MNSGDIEESLVGAYLRHVEQCAIVIYNAYFAGQQGEIDVVGVKETGSRRQVYLCEVTTHIHGMDRDTLRRAPGKLDRLVSFADLTFAGADHHFQWWSPRVPQGAMTAMFERLREELEDAGRSLELIFNEKYTRRVAELVASARANPSTTGEPAYRLLQVLTHMRGAKPEL